MTYRKDRCPGEQVLPHRHLLTPETREALDWYCAAGPDPNFCPACGKFDRRITHKSHIGPICSDCASNYKGATPL